MKQTVKMSRVVNQIESMARKINDCWFGNQLPMDQCIFTVTEQKRSYGFFTPFSSYEVFDKNDGRKEAVQISISSTELFRPIENICATIIHEMTHWVNYRNGVQDCSRQGRYHSKKFKTEAEKHGISVSYDSVLGWSITEPTEELIDWVIEEGFEDFRIQEINYDFSSIPVTGKVATVATTPTKKKSNSRKLICPVCGQIARTTDPNFNLVCGRDMSAMIEA